MELLIFLWKIWCRMWVRVLPSKISCKYKWVQSMNECMNGKQCTKFISENFDTKMTSPTSHNLRHVQMVHFLISISGESFNFIWSVEVEIPAKLGYNTPFLLPKLCYPLFSLQNQQDWCSVSFVLIFPIHYSVP